MILRVRTLEEDGRFRWYMYDNIDHLNYQNVEYIVDPSEGLKIRPYPPQREEAFSEPPGGDRMVGLKPSTTPRHAYVMYVYNRDNNDCYVMIIDGTIYIMNDNGKTIEILRPKQE